MGDKKLRNLARQQFFNLCNLEYGGADQTDLTLLEFYLILGFTKLYSLAYQAKLVNDFDSLIKIE